MTKVKLTQNKKVIGEESYFPLSSDHCANMLRLGLDVCGGRMP